MTRLKDLPELLRDNSNIATVIAAMREVLQTFRGYRGDPLDQALTRRNAIETGILNQDSTPVAGVGGAGTPGPVGPMGPPGTGIAPLDLTPPPTAEGLTVSAGLTSIFVGHSLPVYTQGKGHDRTVVYGAQWPLGAPVPVFADAVVLFEFQGELSSYGTQPGTRWRIWIKWKSIDGVSSVSPAGGTNGALTETSFVSLPQLTPGLSVSITVPTEINGVMVPPGVYFDGANIVNLNAAIARLGSAWIDSAMIGSLSAAQLTAGDGTIGASLKSSNYVDGQTGWKLDQTGTVRAARLEIGNVFDDRFTFDETGAKFFGSLRVETASETNVGVNGEFLNLNGWYNDLGNQTTAAPSGVATSSFASVPVIQGNDFIISSQKFVVLEGEAYTFRQQVQCDNDAFSYTFQALVLFDSNPALTSQIVHEYANSWVTTYDLGFFSYLASETGVPYWVEIVNSFTVPPTAKFASIQLIASRS